MSKIIETTPVEGLKNRELMTEISVMSMIYNVVRECPGYKSTAPGGWHARWAALLKEAEHRGLKKEAKALDAKVDEIFLELRD